LNPRDNTSPDQDYLIRAFCMYQRFKELV